MLAIIQLLVQAVRLTPQLIQVATAIIGLFKVLKGVEPRQALIDFSEALHHAREKQDTSKLEALHARLALALPTAAIVQSVPDATPDAVANVLTALDRAVNK